MAIYDLKDIMMRSQEIRIVNELGTMVYKGRYDKIPMEFADMTIGKLWSDNDVIVIDELDSRY